MGKLLGGGSKQKQQSTSDNQNLGLINSTFTPVAGYAQQGGDAISALLGGDSSGFNNYKNATGFNDALTSGSQGITGNAAANGLLRSGSTGKALASFGAGLNNQFSQNYLSNMLNLANLGTTAGGLLTSAGQRSQSTGSSKSKGGLGSFLGSAAGAVAASDSRLKENIVKIGELKDGLGIYEWTYTYEPGKKYKGVLADEVAKLRPWALGPELAGGYMTVDYDKLEKEVA